MAPASRLPRLLLLATLLAPLAAAAQEAAPPPPAARPADPTYRRHLGFFIRPELGFGYVNSSASEGGSSMTIKGSGAALGLAIGGAVSENFIVAGQVWDMVASNPTVELSGSGTSLSGVASDSSYGLVGYGVLLNWYVGDNYYLAVTPSATRLVITTTSGSGGSEWGLGLRGSAGKEWWVGDHWGLGLAASLGLSSNKDSGATFGSVAFALTFSATYN